MARKINNVPAQAPAVEGLFQRVVAILDQARESVVRSVNSQMLLAYWHVGREIVETIQGGEARAGYGKRMVEELSGRLTARFGRGFSTTNLWYFRQFYLVYADRRPEILHTPRGESSRAQKLHKARGESRSRTAGRPHPDRALRDLSMVIEHPEQIAGFSPRLSWSHYRTLIKVESAPERLFYEIEAEKENWSVPCLERQIHTLLFERLLKSRDKAGVLELSRHGQVLRTATDVLKDPYVLDFLDLPDGDRLHESDVEAAIIGRLQSFLLELGKGFAFVARQKRLAYEDELFYVDLVFYNCILKCYLLIDLKVGKLNHQDIGQMDSYVRMFDDQFATEGDNPTVGLILCAQKNEAIARYSILAEGKQIFAAKYLKVLPTEEALQAQLERERGRLEMRGPAQQPRPASRGTQRRRK
jgi:predicted nuclease of restriction endonuclease-like (RecB) superfamily